MRNTKHAGRLEGRQQHLTCAASLVELPKAGLEDGVGWWGWGSLSASGGLRRGFVTVPPRHHAAVICQAGPVQHKSGSSILQRAAVVVLVARSNLTVGHPT